MIVSDFLPHNGASESPPGSVLLSSPIRRPVRLVSVGGLGCNDPAPGAGLPRSAARDSALWYNPVHDGHGFSITVHSDNSATVYWYTDDAFGRPAWLIGIGDIIGNRIHAQALFLQGMRFGDWNPADRQLFDWGEFSLEFHSCTTATLRYASDLEYASGERFGSGSMPLVRLASTGGIACVE